VSSRYQPTPEWLAVLGVLTGFGLVDSVTSNSPRLNICTCRPWESKAFFSFLVLAEEMGAAELVSESTKPNAVST
jgi:hypothetical protein